MKTAVVSTRRCDQTLLKTGRLGGLAVDIYEQEASLFFQDLSSSVITDDVIVTGHQAFF